MEYEAEENFPSAPTLSPNSFSCLVIFRFWFPAPKTMSLVASNELWAGGNALVSSRKAWKDCGKDCLGYEWGGTIARVNEAEKSGRKSEGAAQWA